MADLRPDRDPFVALCAGLCNHSSLTAPEVGVHTVIKCDELVHMYPFHLFDMVCRLQHGVSRVA